MITALTIALSFLLVYSSIRIWSLKNDLREEEEHARDWERLHRNAQDNYSRKNGELTIVMQRLEQINKLSKV